MRIYEIENGEKTQVMPGYSDEDVFNILKKNCSQAWAAMARTKKMLFRGMGEYEDRPIIHAKTRINRTTATLDIPRQEIDSAFQQAGFKALRTNSISCISQFGEAGNFGKVYIIVPKDGFAFTWSPVVGDFGSMTGGSIGVNALRSRMEENGVNTLKELLFDAYRYTDENFPSAINSGNEVSISGEYYALSTEHYMHKFREALR